MADCIQMIVIRGCNNQGEGGEVLDAPKVVMPDGVVDDLIAAFQAKETHKVENPDFDAEQPESEDNPRMIPVSPARNMTVGFRVFGEAVLEGYKKEQAKAAAEAQVVAAVTGLKENLQVVE